MAYGNTPFKVSSAHIWFNREWNDNHEKPGWNLLLFLLDGSIQLHFIRDLSGVGALLGRSILNPRSGRNTDTVTADNCLVTIDHTTAVIESEDEYGKGRKARRDASIALLRFNTDRLKPGNEHLPKWRIVTDAKADTYKEAQTMDFKSTGCWIGARHDFHDHGPKMNIKYFGEVEIDNNIAYIMA